MTAGVRWVEVAAAVIERPDGTFLLAQRPVGKVYSGWWEFPGGKVEPGESAADALARELREELGIQVEQAYPWITREHEYEHGNVRLHFFRVVRWHGEPCRHEHAALAWQRLQALDVSPMLPANAPVLKALALPLVMGITRAASRGVERFLDELERSLGDGLRLVQVREPTLDPVAFEDFAQAVVARARPHGAIVVLNGPASVAERVRAHGVHLSAAALARTGARPDLEWVGASCHAASELERAERLGLDYAVLGPVLPTPTHPGQPGLGWERFADLIRESSIPVYAIGGMTPADLDHARLTGAHGIAAIRAAWD